MQVSRLVQSLQLLPHPEGGFYKETFRDDSVHLATSSLPPQYKVDRPVSTAIYYLLPAGNVSKLHRLPAAEVWHFYLGEPLTVMEISDDGHVKHTVLGQDLEAGQVLQHTVPPLVWFGAYPTKDVQLVKDGGCCLVKAEMSRDSEHHFSLVGCTVSPAFQFEDSEMAKRSVLCTLFPHAKECIRFLTAADED
ncbi:hypothetical protein GOP47_0000082 [Adiantum capillus-veneris]|uniref:DUF985 domain-containing protein n=1 Tax=Adiantum capillus-veneris TaxID=13818 RepID=A0A9D4VE91_ADICA|nr:hypothetical protein GOP47_0000082 [Adiantum capillus-veneris]